MAHKTRVSGTAYGISGGKTLVGGTGYSISKGRTLVGGTGYNILFSLPAGSSIFSNFDYIYCVTYGNGYYVIGGSYSTYARIAYTTSLDGAWTIKDLWTVSRGNASIRSIIYANGYWVATGECTDYSASQTFKMNIGYATSITGTWTKKTLLSNSNDTTFGNSVIYDGTYFIVSGCTGGYDKDSEEDYWCAIVRYATTPSGTWSGKTVYRGYGGGKGRGTGLIAYGNGYYAVTVTDSVDSTTYVRIAYATSLSGTWTTKDLWSLSSGTTNYTIANDIKYINGNFVVSGIKGGIAVTPNAMIAYGTKPSSLVVKTLWTAASGTSSNSGENNQVNSVTYGNGNWYVGGACSISSSYICNRLSYGTSLDSLQHVDFWKTGLNNNNTATTECDFVNGYLIVFPKYNAGDSSAVITEGQYLAYGNSVSEIVNSLET